MKLSVIIPTLNEEKDLPGCLESLAGLADEIVVVDSGSTDRTIELARKAGARIVSHKFTSFSDTRNFGDQSAKGDWILSIEADVVIPPELKTEIQAVILSGRFDAYYIGRRNIIWGQEIKHTDWSPKDDIHIWLYKKEKGSWKSLVHEEYKTSGKVGKLKNSLIHYNYETVSEFIGKIDSYSELAIKQNQHFPVWWFVRDFLKRYFYKLGFLDGYRGLFLSYLQAVYYLTLTAKRYTKGT